MAKHKFLYSAVSTLRPIVVMVVTLSPSFSLWRIVVCPAASSSTIKIPTSVLPTKRSQILVKAKPMATNTQRRAWLCPIPPGRGFSPELSASSIPSNVVARRCSPQSVVCQQSSRTRTRPRHAASAPAAATAATVAPVLLLLLCNCNLLLPSAVFLGALPSLNCYCVDTSLKVHATDGFVSSMQLLSFVTFLPSPLIFMTLPTPRINVSI